MSASIYYYPIYSKGRRMSINKSMPLDQFTVVGKILSISSWLTTFWFSLVLFDVSVTLNATVMIFRNTYV